MKQTIVLILILMTLLTSCNTLNLDMINETYKPELNASPINGTWEVSNIIISESRDSYNIGDEFHFNVEFFATGDRIYLNPEFEIIKANWNRFISNKRSRDVLEDLIKQEEVNIIEIVKDRAIIAEIIPISSDTLFIEINNEFLEIKKTKESFNSAEINELKESFADNEKITDKTDSWTLGIGISRNLSSTDIEKGYDYTTVLMDYKDNSFKTIELDGIVINDSTGVDIYDVERTAFEENLKDQIKINGNNLSILDREESTSSNLFRITYFSENYATLEYIHPNSLNTLSTYSTNTIGGLNQLRIDEIVDYSYDRVIDAINSSNTDATFAQTVFNIGIGRENGYTVVKGRVPTANGESYNKDFVISSNFSYLSFTQDRLDFHNLRSVFPDLVDGYKTPIENQVIIITKDSIEVYNVDRTFRNYERIYNYEIGPDTNIVSLSWIEDIDLDLDDENPNTQQASRRAK